MHVAKKLSAILFGTLLAAACADGGQITEPPLRAPDAPALDGIGWAGSGNRSDSTATEPTGSGWAGSGNMATSDSTTRSGAEAAGIGWAGSGN